jgi:ERCC4-type nuclease
LERNILPIFVDCREHLGTGKHKWNELAALLMEKELPVEVQQLKSGDIVINDKIGIERKTIEDLKNTLTAKNRDLWEQIKVLKDTYKHPLLLLEGYVNEKDVLLTSIINSIRVGWSLPIVYSKDITDSALKIQQIWNQYGERKYKGQPPAAVIRAKTPNEIKWAMLQTVKGIGPQTATRILTEFPDIFKSKYNYHELKCRFKEITRLNGLSLELLLGVLSSDL